MNECRIVANVGLGIVQKTEKSVCVSAFLPNCKQKEIHTWIVVNEYAMDKTKYIQFP